MEFGERKRSRKSQSFKLVTDEVVEPSLSHKDAIRGPKDATVPDDWLGDEGMEIKRQITGMMRILSDKTGRGYQRPGPEQSQDRQVTWGQQPAPLQLPAENNHNNWTSPEGGSPSAITSTLTNGLGCGQYTTRSRALRGLNSTKDLTKAHQVNAVIVSPSAAEMPCCMCNCKDTLEAILQELRVMRKIMQSQKSSLEKQEPAAASPCQPHLPGPAPRLRPFKRRPIYKVPPLTVSTVRRAALSSAQASPTAAAPAETGNTSECEKEPEPFRADILSISSEIAVESRQDNESPNSEHTSLLNQQRKHLAPESEVRLVEDYDVFISKAQLDSILINYTRSGSLLFRKLVCAFFDDATLANSLPNGKRKRGLNDNRKGLDQNIVGAIKAFTEKYCTEHKIDKLPGPRDWVQILQDQIKLARRRLKRDAAEGVLNEPTSSMNNI